MRAAYSIYGPILGTPPTEFKGRAVISLHNGIRRFSRRKPASRNSTAEGLFYTATGEICYLLIIVNWTVDLVNTPAGQTTLWNLKKSLPLATTNSSWCDTCCDR